MGLHAPNKTSDLFPGDMNVTQFGVVLKGKFRPWTVLQSDLPSYDLSLL